MVMLVRSAALNPPQRIQVDTVTETSVSFSWSPVQDAQSYRIQAAFFSTGTFETLTEVFAAPLESPDNFTTISNLVIGRPLYLTVTSGTADGVFGPEPSAPIRATPIGPPEQPVTNLFVFSYDETALEISWEQPSSTPGSGPAATHFAVFYGCGGDPLQLYPSEFTALQATLEPLGGWTIGSSCDFQIASRNLNYNPADPWAGQISGILRAVLVGPPGVINNLLASDATLSSITLSWNDGADPVVPASGATGYQVSYAAIINGMEGPTTIFAEDVDVTTRVVEVTGLEFGVLYRFTVQTRNLYASGYQPGVSQDVRVEGPLSVPVATIDAVDATTVSISWQAPQSTHPLEYEVRYSSASTGVVVFPTSLRQYIVQGLTEGAPVLIQVRAINRYAPGPYFNLTVTPLSAPSAPSATVTLSLPPEDSEQSLLLSWAAVPLADRFRVERQEESGTFVFVTELGEQTQATMTGLIALTTYTFRIFAGNLAGFESSGAVSNSVQTTAVAQPSLSVANLTVAGVTATSVRLRWDVDPAQRVTAYRVVQSEVGSASSTESEVLASDQPPEFNATGLSRGASFEFTVTPRSANRAGYAGVPSASIVTKTVTKPSVAVAGLRVVSITDSSATLAWDKITPDTVTQYLIQGFDQDNGTVSDREALQPDSAATEVRFEVTGLFPARIYTFFVTARNLNIEGYEGVPSTRIDGVEIVGLPLPVDNIRVSGLTSTSVSISWDPSPIEPRAFQYQVVFRRGTLEFSNGGLQPTERHNQTVFGLRRGESYDFRVFAGNLAGFEVTGSAVVSAAPVSKPLPVEAVRVTEITDTTISLEWTPVVVPEATMFQVRAGDQVAETTENSFVVRGLSTGVRTLFTVFARSFNTLGYEPYGASAIVTPIDAPALVTTLEITSVTITSVNLRYDPSQLENVTKFKVQFKRATSPDFVDLVEYQCRIDEQFLESTPLCDTAFTVSNLVTGVLYDFRVMQRNSNTKGYLEGGNIVSGRPVTKPTRAATNVRVAGVTTSAVFLALDPPVGQDIPTHYTVVYSQAGNYSELLSTEFVAVPDLIVNVSGLIQDVEYEFQLIGRNLNLDGYQDAVRSIAIVAAPIARPGLVQNLQITEVSSDSVSLSWEPPIDPVIDYQVEVANKTVLVNGVVTDILVLGLAPDFKVLGQTAELQFQAKTTANVFIASNVAMLLSIRAGNINIEGYGERALIVASPTPAPENSPSNFDVQRVTENSILLTWQPPLGFEAGDDSVTKYRIEGCRMNCGSADPFPAVAEVGDKYYLLGGAEYEWTGVEWESTGVVFWSELDIVPFTTMEYNVTRIDGQPLNIKEQYEFRIAAGNLNTVGYGPTANLGPISPAFFPGPPREVVISNPKNDRFALNFIAPILTNTTGVPTQYKVVILDVTSNIEYDYPTLLPFPASILSGLLPGTSYRVHVFAGNLAGFESVGARSSMTVKTTAQPCTQDCCATVASSSCTSACCGLLVRRAVDPYIELVWTAPANLALLQFRAGYRLGGSSGAYISAGTTLSNTIVIGPLDFTAVEYQIQVTGGQRSTNTFDAASLSAYIRVRTEPPVYTTFRILTVNVTIDSVLLEWERPVALSAMQEVEYAVELSVDGFTYDALNNTRLLPSFMDPREGDAISYLVSDLQQSQLYNFRILAKTPYITEFQNGIASEEVSVAPLAQPDPVQNLRIIEVTSMSVAVTWDKPTDTPITAYRLSWDGFTVEFEGSITVWNVTGLSPDEQYTFSLRARNFNVNGFGDEAIVVGGPEGLPLKPTLPRMIQFFEDAVELSWAVPAAGPRPLSFEVQCRVQEDPALDALLAGTSACASGPISAAAPFIAALSQGADRRFAQVQGLGTGYTYQFRICAKGANVLGITEDTCSDYVTVTPEGPPTPVQLSLSSVTVESVTLWWTAPASAGSSWSFVPGKDQPGSNLRCPGGTVAELQAACEDERTCEGVSTDGCLKSRISSESEWIDYLSNRSAVGACCVGVNDPPNRGCAVAGEELKPKPACGCACQGLFKKNLQYLLQMSVPPEPFANIYVGKITDRFATRVSRRSGCTDCANCPADCITVPGLTLGALHQFRVFARSLNGLGYASDSSNILDAIPAAQPSVAVTDLRLEYTFDSRAVFAWSPVTGQPVTKYRFQISLDNSQWFAELGGIELDEVEQGSGELTGGASLLTAGTRYWFRVQARNLNSNAYENVPASNSVSATPFDTIENLMNLEVPSVSACVTASCCACCAANLCRGIGTVALTWSRPIGPITHYRIQVADVDSLGNIGTYSTFSDTISASATSASVTSLLIGRFYAFKVQAGSTNFFVYSQECNAFSAPDADCPAVVIASPYTIPTTSVELSLRNTFVTSSSFGLEFEAISSEPVTRYRIAYGPDLLSPYDMVFAEVNHISGKIQVEIDGLEEGRSYFASVTPRNLNVLGYANCPSSADAVTWENLGGGTYSITWQAPAWDPPITSYRIWYQRNETTVTAPTLYSRFDLISSSSELVEIVDGLDPSAVYTFWVTPSAAPCAVFGPNFPLPRPSVVSDFRVVAVTSTSISSAWADSAWAEAPPVDGRAVPTLYMMAIAASNDGVCETATYMAAANLTVPAMHFVFSDLTPYQQYCIRIQPVNNNIEPVAPASYVSATPTPRPTVAPSGLAVVSKVNGPANLDDARVTLEWVAPTVAVGEPPVFRYRVAFWPDSEAECLQKPVYVTCEAYSQFSQIFTETKGVVSRLRPATSYWFKIFAGNLNGFEEEGSTPLGPIHTSQLPKPVEALRITAVTDTSVTLAWRFAAPVVPSKLKLEYSDSAAMRESGFEEMSCSVATSPCPTTKTWTGLTTGTTYTFRVHTGGPIDPLVPLSSTETYTGIASISGRPYSPSDPPEDFRLVSWTDTSVRLAFKLPAPDVLKGPVEAIYLEGRVGAGPWLLTSAGAPLAWGEPEERVSVHVSTIGGAALAGYDGSAATTYDFRVFAMNRNANSSAAELLDVKLYFPPSTPLGFQRSPGAVGASFLDLIWSAPAEGAEPDIGFEYSFEVSDDHGVTYTPVLGGPYALSSNASRIELVGDATLRRVREGAGYVCRIRAKNQHEAGFGPPASLLMHPVSTPGPVRNLGAVAASAASATIAWDAPAGVWSTSPVEARVRYQVQAALFSVAPVFSSLQGVFLDVPEEWISLSLSALVAEMTSAGVAVPSGQTRFFFRVLAQNSAGISEAPAPILELLFEGVPEVAVEGFRVESVTHNQVNFRWTPHNRSESLEGYRIRVSRDGLHFSTAVEVPVEAFNEAGDWVATSSAAVENLPDGRYWFDIIMLGRSGPSLYFATIGPLWIPNVAGEVTGLGIESVTEGAVLLTWSNPAIPVIGWEVAFSADSAPASSPVFTAEPRFNVTGLQLGPVYTFFVRSRSFGGESAYTAITGSPASPPTPPYNLKVLASTADSVTIGWSVLPSLDPYTFLLSFAEENEDGDFGFLEPVGQLSAERQRTVTGLKQGISYTLAVQSQGLHESGLSSTATLSHRLASPPPPPRNLSMAFHRARSLVAEWQEPADTSAVEYYKLRVLDKTTLAPVELFFPPGTTIAQPQDLSACNTYDLVLSSCNVAGCSAAPAIANALTAPEQAVGVGLSAMTSNSLTLTWTAPQPPRAYSYTVRYRRITAPGASFFVTDGRLVLKSGTFADVIYLAWNDQTSDNGGADTQVTLALQQDTTYQFAVIVEFQNINSDPYYYVGTPAERPQQVLNLKVAAVLQDSLQIQWDPPSASLIESYTISYFETNAAVPVKTFVHVSFTEVNEELDGSGTNFLTVAGLTTYERYTFDVQAANLAGADVPLVMSIFDPPPVPVPQPGRVQFLQVTSATTTTVTLAWQAPPGGDEEPSFLVGMTYRVTRAAVTAGVVGAHTVVTDTTQTTASVPALILGSTYEFRVTAQNENSLGYGPAKVLLGGPLSACASNGCLVQGLGVVAYSGKSGAAEQVSITLGWRAPAEAAATSFFLAFYYKVEYVSSGGAVSAVTGSDLSPATPHVRITAVNGAALTLGASYTFRVTARNLNSQQYGQSVEVVGAAREQPSALTDAPVVVQTSVESVTLAWTALAPASEHSYKIVYRTLGSEGAFAHPTYVQAALGTARGLRLGTQYEFKVLVRNLHEDGFEAQGSPVLVAGPAQELGSPGGFRLRSVTASTVTLEWDPPASSLGDIVYRILVGTDVYDPANTTVAEVTNVETVTASGLTAGARYVFTLSALDAAGRSPEAQTPGRPVAPASAVANLQAKAKDADDSGLSWDPPPVLSPSVSSGLTVDHYIVEVAVPLGSGSGTYELLGTTTSNRFNHAGIDVKDVSIDYRVAAVIRQSPEFGAVLQQGAAASVSLFFGSAPSFAAGTPADGAVLIAGKEQALVIPLHASSPDVPAVGIFFRTTGSTPSVLSFTPAVPVVDVAAQRVSQNVSVAYDLALAGTDFLVCFQAEDSNGLRTGTRCFTLLIPRPAPRLLTPANESRYQATIGCSLDVVMQAEDRTSAGLEPAVAATSGFGPAVVVLSVLSRSSYTQRSSSLLPTSATLETEEAPPGVVSNPVTSVLRWAPIKGQEGFTYRICMVPFGVSNEYAPLCLFVEVMRCQFCAKEGDSMQTMAREWHTTWTELWSGNHLLVNPDLLIREQVYAVGPVYSITEEEDLERVAFRYGVATADLLWWNPDLADSAAQAQQYALQERQAVCVIPQSCIYRAAISSAVTQADLDSPAPPRSQPHATPVT